MKCAGYIRVSKDRMEQKTSIINQMELLSQFAHNNNWQEPVFYTDVGTGANDKRENLQRLIADIESKKFDVLLVKESSRFARKGELAFKIKQLCEDKGVHLIALDDSINTLKGNTEQFGYHVTDNEKEINRCSKRIKAALLSRAREGLFNGSVPPYGYYCEDSRLYIRNDNTPNIVKRIFREYIEGRGYDAIAKGLFEDNIPTPSTVINKVDSSTIWNGSTVAGILKNKAYIGYMVQNKEATVSALSTRRITNTIDDISIVEDTHKAIISKEDFNIVQELIKVRSKQKVHQSSHLFTNIIFCKDCGKGMHFKKNRKGYVCGSFNKLGSKACSSHLVREHELSSAILNDINNFLNSDDKTLKNEVLNKVTQKIFEFETNITTSKNKIKILEKRNSKLLDLLLDEKIPQRKYKLKETEIDEQIDTLTKEIDLFKLSISKLKSALEDKTFNNLFNSSLNITELSPAILHRFIKRIEISEDGSPTIFYRFAKTSTSL